MEKIEFLVENRGQRVDKFLAKEVPNLSRSYLQKLIKDEQVVVNGKPCRCSDILNDNDHLVVFFPKLNADILEIEEFKVPILFEDDYILVVNKPAGLIVHPGNGNSNGTLVNQLMGYKPEVFGVMIDDEKRPGIVHRLDRDTTGGMVIAKTEMVMNQLKKAFQGRNINKEYLALTKGIFKNDEDIIDTWYGRDLKNRQKMAVLEEGGKAALTRYRVLARHNGVSLVQVRLETGRTHQIRVHLDYLGHPILGDDTYGTKQSASLADRQMLHSWRLSFYHPVTKERLFFEAKVPADFVECAKRSNIELS